MTAERVTLKDCEEVAANLNRRLESVNATSRVRLERRYDYLAADEYGVDGSMRRTLFAGTKREVYTALWHMIRGIDLYSADLRI